MFSLAAVKLTVGRIVGDQLMELRCEMNAIAERLEHIDRKTWHSAKPQTSETLLE